MLVVLIVLLKYGNLMGLFIDLIHRHRHHHHHRLEVAMVVVIILGEGIVEVVEE